LLSLTQNRCDPADAGAAGLGKDRDAPTPGTSKIGFISLAPRLCAFFTRASTSSTAMYDIQLSGTGPNCGALISNIPPTGLPFILATQ